MAQLGKLRSFLKELFDFYPMQKVFFSVECTMVYLSTRRQIYNDER